MRIRSPSLPELHAFIAVARTGSFSRAATQLCVTQGAVSRAVLRLESRLGLVLLDRGSTATRLTAAGEQYFGRIHLAVAALEEAVPQAPRQRGGELLRLSVVHSLNMRWLVPRMPALHARLPWLRIEFKPFWFEENFQRPDVDCWIRVKRTATSRWPRHIRATYLLGKEFVPICHPHVAPHIKQPADLLRHPLLHHASYPGNWAAWFASCGVETRTLQLGPGFDLGVTLIEAVESNVGVAVIQRCLIERELAEGRLVVPLDAEVSIPRGYYFCVPKASEGAPAVAALRQWLLEQAGAK